MIKRINRRLQAAILTASLGVLSASWANNDNQPEQITVQHFAYHVQLSEGKDSLRQLLLNEHVMTHLQRRDGGDLRVFNADGQIVPHLIKTVGAEQAKAASQDLSLRFYPFSEHEKASQHNLHIQIQQQDSGQSLQIDSNTAEKADNKAYEYQYIIENNKQDMPLCGLKVAWQQAQPSQIIPLTLEVSNDLNHWTSLVNRATLSRLVFAGSQLEQNTLRFRCTTQKYLRLSWQKPQQSIHLTGLVGHYQQHEPIAEQSRNLGKPNRKGDAKWFFDMPVALPLTGLSFQAPEAGLLYQGQLYAKRKNSDNWQYMTRFLQYQLKQGDAVTRSTPIVVQGRGFKHWKVLLQGQTAFQPQQLPDIVAYWQPRKLVFLAQGKAPFTLAYGNAEVDKAADNGIGQIVSQNTKDLEQVTLQTPVHNPKPLPFKEPEKKTTQTPWKLISFWILLILGTAVLGYMVYSLYRQINTDNREDT